MWIKWWSQGDENTLNCNHIQLATKEYLKCLMNATGYNYLLRSIIYRRFKYIIKTVIYICKCRQVIYIYSVLQILDTKRPHNLVMMCLASPKSQFFVTEPKNEQSEIQTSLYYSIYLYVVNMVSLSFKQ